MDVRLSAEQRALRDSAAVLVNRLRATSVRELADRERSRKLDAAVTASGWREMRGASDDGGPWSSVVEVCIVAEELGQGAADTAFVGPTLAAELRRLAAATAATGAETVVFRADLTAPAMAAAATQGRVAIAIDAAESQAALLLVPQPGGYALAEFPVSSEGDAGVDLTRAFVTLDMPEDAALSGGRVITDDELARWTALGLAMTAADLVGVMRGAIRLACDHAATRKQFGSAVGSFQAVQHLLADAYVAMEGSSSVALHAAWAVDALPAAGALAAASVAKAYASRAARSVCETAIQVHGGIGNTWECFAHVYLRRALVSIDLLGGVGDSLARVLEHHGIGGGRGLR